MRGNPSAKATIFRIRAALLAQNRDEVQGLGARNRLATLFSIDEYIYEYLKGDKHLEWPRTLVDAADEVFE